MTVAVLDSAPTTRPWTGSALGRLTGAPGDEAYPAHDPIPALEALLRQVEAAARLLGGRLALDMGLFTERAVELGLRGRGRTACNGSARMLRTADGWAVANLARPEDVELVPAWIGAAVRGEAWDALALYARGAGSEAFVATGRLLGVATAVVRRPGEVRPISPPPRRSPAGRVVAARALRVVDLSALWAGPPCGRLFSDLGARVTKVEGLHRPDAMRMSAPRLFAKLHAGQDRVVLDFASQQGRRALAQLIAQADVVIEASRPRALRQLGIDAEAWLDHRAGRTWISLTAYGREGEAAGWIGFGDDVAASAGLVAFDRRGEPVFLGDAIADPIAGLTAACQGMHAVADGGGMVAVAMHEAAAAIAAAPRQPGAST